ncbi:hypothetical protein Q9966_006802 [Columba livia]|nr:hypothetical protein Q9966_006802 [Columba livia]
MKICVPLDFADTDIFAGVEELQAMSQTGEESSSSSDTESEIENEQLICTLAPTVYSRDEGSIDVAASPAFQCLDEFMPLEMKQSTSC